jgi:U4/U6.U5 tri-snRNP component SNU23
MNVFVGKSTEKTIAQNKDMLKHRDYKIDLDGKLGKTVVVTKTTPQAQSGG